MPEDEVRDIIDGLNIANNDWSLRLMDDIALRFGVSSRAFLHRINSMNRIDKGLFANYDARLQDPATFTNTTIFAPRPPLPFGTWLNTLRLRAKSKHKPND